MRFTPFALVAGLAQTAFAAPSARGFACGAPEPDAEHIRISQKFAAQEAAALASGAFSIQATIAVDTYFHVVSTSSTLSGGNVPVRRPTPY